MNANYKITETADAYRDFPPYVEIEIAGVSSVPAALKRLAELGYDMAPSLDALQKAVEEQRKRKALEAAIADIAKKSEE